MKLHRLLFIIAALALAWSVCAGCSTTAGPFTAGLSKAAALTTQPSYQQIETIATQIYPPLGYSLATVAGLAAAWLHGRANGENSIAWQPAPQNSLDTPPKPA